MNRLPLLLSLAAVATTALAQQPTNICNPRPWDNKLFLEYTVGVDANDSRIQAMVAAVQNPSSNPSLYDRMQRPTSVGYTSTSMTLSFDPLQDPAELDSRIEQDSQLASPFFRISTLGTGCTGAQQQLTIVEYQNAALKRFYLSANGAEMQWLESGGGGGGWARTGQIWTTYSPGPGCSAASYSPVYQFYSAQRHAHYYTTNPQECGYLRTNNIGWSYIATPFGAQATPCQGQDKDALTPVSMFYHPQEGAHRFSSNIDISESMRVQGWDAYGPVMCVKSNRAP